MVETSWDCFCDWSQICQERLPEQQSVARDFPLSARLLKGRAGGPGAVGAQSVIYNESLATYYREETCSSALASRCVRVSYYFQEKVLPRGHGK